jgi:hypothetical protein
MTKAIPLADADRRASRARKLAMLLVSLAALGAIVYMIRGREKAIPAATPVKAEHLDALNAFIKHQACKPSSCTDFVCETFSAGPSRKGVPSYLARCRWSDSTTTDFKRCAYVHYSVNAQEKIYTDLFLSSPARSDTCATDQRFNDLIKKDVGYSGALP